MASAVADVAVTLVQSSSTLADSNPSGSIRVADLQATSKLSVEQILAADTQAADIEVSKDAIVGTVLYSCEIAPGTLTTNTQTRVEWLSKLYKFWHGDMEFKFIFTKTILQQMKLLAVFVPRATIDQTPPSVADAFMYTHKLVMNPANETQFAMKIPFVSTQPYHEMTQSTGMFYIMLYQPMTVSVTDTNQVYIKVFVSGADLKFHEFIPLPRLATSGGGGGNLSESQLWTLAPPGGRQCVPGGTASTAQFITDSGAVRTTFQSAAMAITTPLPTVDLLASTPVTAELVFMKQSAYDPTLCFTIWGHPSGTGTGRGVTLIADAYHAGDADFGRTVHFLCYTTVDGCWMSESANSTDSQYCFSDGLLPLNGQIEYITPSTTAEMVMAEQTAKIMAMFAPQQTATSRNELFTTLQRGPMYHRDQTDGSQTFPTQLDEIRHFSGQDQVDASYCMLQKVPFCTNADHPISQCAWPDQHIPETHQSRIPRLRPNQSTLLNYFKRNTSCVLGGCLNCDAPTIDNDICETCRRRKTPYNGVHGTEIPDWEDHILFLRAKKQAQTADALDHHLTSSDC